MAEPLAWALALGLAGAIVGSFVAALAIRWPEGRSVTRGRSACDSCHATLSPRELVPLLSFLVQRGCCRSCRARIDRFHVGVEATALLVGTTAGWIAPGAAGMAGAAFGWLLLALAALDLRAFWLPDRLTALLALAGLGSGAAGVMPPIVDRLWGGAIGYAGLAAIGWGYRRWRGREGLGGGDPKLFGAIGLWLGWRLLPAVLLIAALVGLGAALVAQRRGGEVRRDTAMPFGTLLAVAAYPAWLAMIGWAS
ncbi:prepilin peptidase [Sphingomonas sp. XXL09]|uniref:prepilin peptidase n=1 Tax=Sphingomonas sp. XXL09 TaxID=3457787 RepID=UPI00406BCCB0